ncbi:uncharacterized protein MAM_04754 [Metarhizium album ARSEF 1941]|uniref:LEA domain protein n=1 Tax=Metarhizium album (strain ARSEF 1941) TaxID=1081103 RepID=A0A0B2WUI8_METAS|nr:uncharacterized protein MAM_04754 [Metarhizium album ARSEF 1941]KHN97157.1 hypothetical protein MAM_04754 [Metarhizium album ARSEF 1941]
MSLLAKRGLRYAAPMCSRATPAQGARAFGASVAARKSPTDTVKDGLKTVDRTVTDNVVLPGLEAATSAGSKIKEGAEAIAHGSKGKAAEVKGKAKGAAAEAEGKAKGAAENIKSQL